MLAKNLIRDKTIYGSSILNFLTICQKIYLLEYKIGLWYILPTPPSGGKCCRCPFLREFLVHVYAPKVEISNYGHITIFEGPVII